MPCEDEGRDQGDTCASQEEQRLPANHTKWGKGLAQTLSQPSEGNPAKPRFWTSSLQDCDNRFQLFKVPSCVILLWQLQETVAPLPCLHIPPVSHIYVNKVEKTKNNLWKAISFWEILYILQVHIM